MSVIETSLLAVVFCIMTAILLGGSVVLNTALKQRNHNNVNISDIEIDNTLKSRRFFLYSTVGGTLTSLASVYVFFLLQYPYFGGWMFFTLLAFPLGGLIGQVVSTHALKQFSSNNLTKDAISTGLMASIVRVTSTQATASLVKAISIVNIFALVWLEIKILTTIILSVIFSIEYGPENAVYFGVVAAVLAGLLVQFVLRFGMQGVIATDALYWPFIILSVGLMIIVVLYLAIDGSSGLAGAIGDVKLEPLIDPVTLCFFLLNIFLVNAVYHVGRDDLWLRLSAFHRSGGAKNPAASELFRATLFAAPVWMMLIIVGMLLPVVAKGTVNDIVELVNVVRISPLIVPVVILGMLAAMLSTCDNQFFALKRLFAYSPKDNSISVLEITPHRAASYSAAAGLLVFLLTWSSIVFGVEDQNLVFACLGLPAVAFPVVFRAVKAKSCGIGDVLLPSGCYLTMVIVGINAGGVPSIYIIAAAPVSLLVGLAFSWGRK